MIQYIRILSEFANTVWAIEREKLQSIAEFLLLRAQGETLSEEEIVARTGGRDASRTSRSANGVTILPVYGVISNRVNMMSDISGGTSIEKLTAQFREAMADPNVGTILFDVDSPGGSVNGVQELVAEIRNARGQKRIVAQVNPLAASAAYWLASAASEIAITPSGSAGSIGVYMTHENLQKMLEQKGIDVSVIGAGKYKTEALGHQALSDEARGFLQGRVDEYYDAFTGDVAKGRGVSVAAVKSGFGQGRAVSAKDALAMGMVDRIATLDQTLAGILGTATVSISARAASASANEVTNPATAETNKELDMSTTATPAVAAGVEVIRTEAASQETVRINAIKAMSRFSGMGDRAQSWIANGKSVDEVSAEIDGLVTERNKTAIGTQPQPGAQVALTEKEQKQYSIVRAVAVSAGLVKDTKSFEMEVSASIAKKLGKETNGVYVPTNIRGNLLDAEQREKFGAVLTAVTAPATNVVQTTIRPDEFIDLLRNRMTVMKAGARKLGDLQGNLQLPKQTAAATLSWTGENPGSPVTASDQTIGNVTLSPKTAMAQTLWSRQLLLQSSLDVEQFVREDLANVFAIGVDLAALNGSGSSNQPRGILNASGINVVAIGTNGGAITYNLLIDCQTALDNNNVPLVSTATITTPGVKGKLRKTAKLANTITEAIWDDDNVVAGFPAMSTNQMPSTLTKGTSSGILHALISGDFSQLIIAEWGVLELIADPYTQAGKGNVVLTGSILCDIGVRYGAAFSVITDIDPTL